MDSVENRGYALTASRELKKRQFRELIQGLLFASPVLLGFLIFVVGPIIYTLVLSFTSYNVVSSPKFVGLANYKVLLCGQDAFFYPAVKATLYYVLVSVPLGIVFAFFIAILLNMKIKGRTIFRTIFYLPAIIPIAASSMIWLWLLQPDFGVVNYVLEALHLPTSRWLSSDATVMPTLVLISLWTTGNMIVIFLAGLQNISAHLYEAIEVDGGNMFHKLIYITIPMSSSIIFFNTVIGFINGFQTFVQPYVMTQGGPNKASYLYVYYLFLNP